MLWKYTLDFNRVVREVDEMDFDVQRKTLSESLKSQAEALPNVDGQWLQQTMKEFATCINGCEDREEIDSVLDEVYDFADSNAIWMGL